VTGSLNNKQDALSIVVLYRSAADVCEQLNTQIQLIDQEGLKALFGAARASIR